jgi:hypothetical protein
MSRLFLDLFIQGAVSALALYLLGVPYALALGAWVSLAALILYFGSVLGAVPAVIMAFTVSGVHRLAADGSPDDHRILHHSAGEGQQPHAPHSWARSAHPPDPDRACRDSRLGTLHASWRWFWPYRLWRPCEFSTTSLASAFIRGISA